MVDMVGQVMDHEDRVGGCAASIGTRHLIKRQPKPGVTNKIHDCRFFVPVGNQWTSSYSPADCT